MTVEHASSSLQELRIVQLVPHWENLAAPLAYHNLVSGRGKFCVWIAITHGRMATASMVYSNQGAQCIGPSNAFSWDGAISEIRPLGAIYTRRALSLAAKYLLSAQPKQRREMKPPRYSTVIMLPPPEKMLLRMHARYTPPPSPKDSKNRTVDACLPERREPSPRPVSYTHLTLPTTPYV